MGCTVGTCDVVMQAISLARAQMTGMWVAGNASARPAEYDFAHIHRNVMHLAEMTVAPLIEWYFPSPEGHIVVDIGLPDVACLTFSQPESKYRQMVTHAISVTQAHLEPLVASGDIPTKD